MKSYRFVTLFAGIFTGTLVITNLLNTKIIMLFGFSFPAGILTFPITFLIADALTEVYGYRITRQVIWSGFAALIFMAIAVPVAIHLPAAPFWQQQAAFEAILQQVPRIVLASILAYWAGEFCNSYVLARSKVRSEGRGMPIRFVTSTIAGQGIDTIVFMSIAFIGVFPAGEMLTLFISSWIFKVVWELIALPISVPFVKWLKSAEGEDYFDKTTNFTPFSISVADNDNARENARL